MILEFKNFNKDDFVEVKDGRKGTVVSVIAPKYIQLRMTGTNKILAFEVGDIADHKPSKPRVSPEAIQSATDILHKSFRLRDTVKGEG
jgi:hypothetical protein